MPLRPVPALLALGVYLLAATGCANPDPSPPSNPPPPPVPGPVFTPPPAPLPPTEDGTDVAACTDGSCEVQLSQPSEIPLDPRFGVRILQVASIGPDRVALRSALEGGGEVASASCVQRAADATATAPASVTAECEPGGTLTLPTISVGVAVIRQNSAIIRIRVR